MEFTRVRPILNLLLKRIGFFAKVYLKNRKFLRAFLLLIFVPPVLAVTYFFFFVDRLFYPNLNDVEIEKPVFIMGHPRSGTTFLQKCIAHTDKVAFSTTFELAVPSLVLRNVLKPLFDLFSNIDVNILNSARKGHELSIYDVEEDEGVFLHTLNTEMLSIFCPWMIFDSEYEEEGLKIGWSDERERQIDIDLLREYIKREIVWHRKDRMVLKTNPSIFRINQILENFPEAKLIYIIRSPVDTLSSFFSFHDRYLSTSLTEDEHTKYFEQKYKWSRHLYEYFERVRQEIPDDQLMVVPFNKLVNDIEPVLEQIADFIEIQPEKEYFEEIREIMNSNRSKKHENKSLEYFDLSEEKVKEDFDFIFDKYPGI